MRPILIPEHARRSKAGLLHTVHEHVRMVPDAAPSAVRAARCKRTEDMFQHINDARLLREAAAEVATKRIKRGLLRLAERMENER